MAPLSSALTPLAVSAWSLSKYLEIQAPVCVSGTVGLHHHHVCRPVCVVLLPVLLRIRIACFE